jgi:isopentenyl-diphosphate delta-isomerase
VLNQETWREKEVHLSGVTDTIKLDPVLPWVSSGGLVGWVIGASPDSLLLRPSSHMQRPPVECVISVQLGSAQSFGFSGQWVRKDDDWELRLLEAEQLRRLHDLLGQIRKDQHIEICRREDVEASDRLTGFERLHFLPEALPLVDPSELNTSVEFLGQRFRYPMLITGMTGGIQKGIDINRRLARAAQAFGIPMGVGSQRIALENPEYAAIFKVKNAAPGLFLIGNIGMAQLARSDALDLCRRAVDMIDADALAIHFNVVQECIQVEGDRQFKGLLQQLEHLCHHLPVPVIAKEVGSGISPTSALRLRDLGVAAIDIGGRGGTSWAHIEGLRSGSALVRDLGQSFRNWGAPTAYSLSAVQRSLPGYPLIATGGVRDGLTVAKAVGLGARMVGIGLPLLRAALEGENGPEDVLNGFARGLELTMLATGVSQLGGLRERLTLGFPLEREFQAAFEPRW